jgi:hypothetical protein
MHTSKSRRISSRLARRARIALAAFVGLVAIGALVGCSQPIGNPSGEDGGSGDPPASPGGTDQPVSQVISIDFDAATPGYVAEGFSAAGTAHDPDVGFLDATGWEIIGFSDGDLAFGDEADTGDFARGTSPGGTSTGGLYAFEVAADNRALGVQPTASDFAPGSIALRIPVTIAAPALVSIGYTLWAYNDADRSTRWSCAVSADGTTWETLDDLTVVTDEPAAEAGDLTWVAQHLSAQIDVTELAPEETLYLRWSAEDESGSGGRDEAAIDDITVTIES